MDVIKVRRKKMNKIKRVIKEPHLIITRLMDLNFFWFIPDESYLPTSVGRRRGNEAGA